MKKEDFIAVLVYGFLCIVILLTCASHFVFDPDWLDFYGGIIASVATIMAVVMTIRHSDKQYVKSQTAGIRPYLTLSIMDYDYETRNKILESKQIRIRNGYDAAGKHWSYILETDCKEQRNIICVLKNIGMDTLVKGYISINKSYCSIDSLAKNEEYYFFIVLPEKETELNIECFYEDLLGSEYTQSTYWELIGIYDNGISIGGVLGDLSEPKRTM